jgi:uncharacterized protein (TIGR00251 family)
MEKSDRKSCLITVNVVPRSSKNQIQEENVGFYKARLTAPPVEGKANKALMVLLAKKLRVPQKNIKIVSGSRARVKIVSIRGISATEVDKILGGR